MSVILEVHFLRAQHGVRLHLILYCLISLLGVTVLLSIVVVVVLLIRIVVVVVLRLIVVVSCILVVTIV